MPLKTGMCRILPLCMLETVLPEIHRKAGTLIADSGMVWRFPAAFILISALAFMRLQYGQRIGNNLRAYAAGRYLRLLTRDDLNIFHPYSILSLMLLCISAGILIYNLLMVTGWYTQIPDSMRYGEIVSILLLAACIAAIIIVRSFIYAAVMWVLGEDGGQLENRYAQVIFCQVTGLILTPLAVLCLFANDAYLQVWCVGGLVLLTLTYLYRVVRGVIAGLNNRVSPVYIIYYLCTLEIVPAVVITGVLIRQQ
jgi:hypothetical protein